MPSNQKNSVYNGGVFNAAQGDIHQYQYQHFNGRKGMELLQDSIAPGAFHDSAERYDPPKCHPVTRVAVLEDIMRWINDLHTLCFFLWIHGPAGAGKSAIAQSIAERCHEAKILAASFFFSRTAEEGRNDESRLIPTIVYQLCLSIPAIRTYVEDALERDPLILSRSLEAQLHGLIVKPLNQAFQSNERGGRSPRPVRRLIIIDGLDECGSGEVQRYILTVLAGAVKQLPFPILFLVASRPEQEIRVIFNSPLLAPTTTRLALDNSYLPDNDVEAFLKSKFQDIKKNHPFRELLPSWWPSTSQIQRLVQKSSGQFIYASTVMEYVESRHHQPMRRLDIISGITNPGNDTPFAKLDALYLDIFSPVKEKDKVLKVLCALLLFAHSPGGMTPYLMTPYFLEALLFFQSGDIFTILSDVHSIIDVPPVNLSQWRSVGVVHASLEDFLLDRSRSRELHINAEHAHATLTRHLLRHISNIDSSIQDSHRAAFHSALIPQCLLAYPTKELLEDLRAFDMLKFIRSKTISPFWIMAHLPPLFMWMKKQDANLYSHHLRSWDAYMKNMMSVLVNRSSELGLNFISSLVLPDFTTMTRDINEILVDGLNVEMIGDFADTEDNTLRLISFKYEPKEFTDYHLMISQLLKDSLRSGVFYVDGDRFTILATKFTKYLLRHPGLERTATRTSWQYLPGCLSRSSPSKELAALLNKLKFPPTTSDKHRVTIEKVLEAKKAYISRSLISEIPRNAINVSAILATVKPVHIL